MTCPVHKRKGQVQILKSLHSRLSSVSSRQTPVYRLLPLVGVCRLFAFFCSPSAAAVAAPLWRHWRQRRRSQRTTTGNVAIKFLGERTHFNDESDDSGIGLVAAAVAVVVAVVAIAVVGAVSSTAAAGGDCCCCCYKGNANLRMSLFGSAGRIVVFKS